MQDLRDARAQLARFAKAGVHAVHANRGCLMGGVAGEPDRPFPEASRQAAFEHSKRRPVDLRRLRRPPWGHRRRELLQPLHRRRVLRGVADLKSPAAPPFLERPVNARGLPVQHDARFGGKFAFRFDLVDGEELAAAVLLHRDP